MRKLSSFRSGLCCFPELNLTYLIFFCFSRELRPSPNKKQPQPNMASKVSEKSQQRAAHLQICLGKYRTLPFAGNMTPYERRVVLICCSTFASSVMCRPQFLNFYFSQDHWYMHLTRIKRLLNYKFKSFPA